MDLAGVSGEIFEGAGHQTTRTGSKGGLVQPMKALMKPGQKAMQVGLIAAISQIAGYFTIAWIDGYLPKEYHSECMVSIVTAYAGIMAGIVNWWKNRPTKNKNRHLNNQ
jgi:hypothetical protein